MVIFPDSWIHLKYMSLQEKQAPIHLILHGKKEKYKFSRANTGSSGVSSWIWLVTLVNTFNNLWPDNYEKAQMKK